MSNNSSRISTIVLPIIEPTSKFPLQSVENSGFTGIFTGFLPRKQAWAPAWFYSALNWLSHTYYDANNARQRFGPSMYGSDVDPYARIGSTCLFRITRLRNESLFTLYLALDTDSATLDAGTTFPGSDAGIKAMYLALSSSTIFSAVKFCYIPGLLGSDMDPAAFSPGSLFVAAVPPSALSSGYDPATGLRVIAQGSAVAQVIPLDKFPSVQNEQVYDTTPTIVPVTTSLVYDLSQFNQFGATQFLLPVAYMRDRVQGSYYVNKMGSSATVNSLSAQCGQIAVFTGGPGYNASTATQLTLQSTAVAQPLTTYTFSDDNGIIVVSAVNPGSSVNQGICSLIYNSASPAELFARQQLVGFARSSAWQTSFGVPIVDYGPGNSSFTSAPSVKELAPIAIYNPATPFLNGGSLANVVRNLLQATYLYPTSELISILKAATTSQTTDSGAGLSVTTAALEFNMSSNDTGLADQLSVPVVATFTTTPLFIRPVLDQAGTRVAVPAAKSSASVAPASATVAPSSSTLKKVIDTIKSVAEPAAPSKPAAATPASTTPTGTPAVVARNGTTISIPDPVKRIPVPQGPPIPIKFPLPQGPTSITIGLSAFIPKEALSGTGISSIEIGTTFPQQNLGAGAAVQSSAHIVNLMAREHANAAIVPFALTLAGLGFNFIAGTIYVLSFAAGKLTVRGPGASTSISSSPKGAIGGVTYIGALVYSDTLTTVLMYPLVQLPFTPPAVGANGMRQGVSYNLRLTYGANGSVYDITDADNATIATNIAVANPIPTDKSKPAPGDIYFGSFVGGATQTTLWAVPIFLNVVPSQLTGASFNGSITLNAESSGVPSYDLKITDKSLFIYSNINVDTLTIGSVSSKNVYLASAVINSAPDDLTSAAFAPSKLIIGLVRPVFVGTELQYVFVPEDDSVVIGGVRYMLSVINLGNLTFDPNALPYAPVNWPQSQYWQFANRHNPYLDVQYTGKTQQDRIISAQRDVARIGLGLSNAQEPMQLYLDTNPDTMTVWPIYAFPFEFATQTVDQGALKNISQTIIDILSKSATLKEINLPSATPPVSNASTATARAFSHVTESLHVSIAPSPTSLAGREAAAAASISVNQPVTSAPDAEQILPPSVLTLTNPYTSDAATSPDATPAINTTVAPRVMAATIVGTQVQNLSPNVIADNSFASSLAAQSSRASLQNQQVQVEFSATKTLEPVTNAVQDHVSGITVSSSSAAVLRRRFQTIYGFSVYNTATGEAYIVEVVGSDLTVPDQIPYPTRDQTYDPFYVRVVFLNNLTCYNMSIIVPSMVYDQYGHLANQNTTYTNLLSKKDELGIGYLYSLYDSSNNFDSIDVQVYNEDPSSVPLASQNYLFTNFQYQTPQLTLFNPGILFQNFTSFQSRSATPRVLESIVNPGTNIHRNVNPVLPTENFTFDHGAINYFIAQVPPIYFFCRRKNWNADCHLMQATNPSGTSAYMAFGGGDLVPFRLDAEFDVDKRQPDHLYKFTAGFADQKYLGTRTISVSNTPYIVGVTTQNGFPQFNNLSINSKGGTADLQLGAPKTFTFPTECYVVGSASTMFSSIADVNAAVQSTIPYLDTGQFANLNADGTLSDKQEFQLIPYNNLVYLVRAVSNSPALTAIGGLGVSSGLLIDTYVPTSSGNLALAQGARYKRSGMQYFGSSYTPVTMIDSLDTLDFTRITGNIFYAPTIFIPIQELDASKGIVANLSNFLGEQMWTFVYAEIVAQPGTSVNGVAYPKGFNIDGEQNPILSLQKLHFVYDPLATLFTPNDLTHKYPLLPKQRILALSNDQIREGICWRTANPLPGQRPPQNICAQQILPAGEGMDRPNIIYSTQNHAVITSASTTPDYKGMSVNSIIGISGTVYNIEESGYSGDQTSASFVSSVSSDTNLLISVLFDYNNNDLGNMTAYDPTTSTRGLVFLNGYLGINGYMFSSPDHFDVDDIRPSYIPQLEQVTNIMGQGWDFGFYNTDTDLPRQYWSLTYDTFTAPSLPNFIANTAPSAVDPTFTNRTRSLVLNLQNNVRPTAIGLMDTYSSVVSANLHLQNGVTGSIFLSKKADRDVASIGTNPGPSPNTFPLYGLPTKYDFFIFSRDHYWTLNGAKFELIDQGYAMCLVDDGTGTGNKVASYFIDADGNYYELYNYVLWSDAGGVIETQPFILKVTLGAPANPTSTPTTSETPNNVNPQDLVTQINKLSNIIYAVMGPSSPGQPPAYLPIQGIGASATSEIQAAPITGAPGFNGYTLGVMASASTHLPIQINQIYSGSTAYPIAGTTTLIPYNVKSEKAVPFYGSLSHGLDRQQTVPTLYSADGLTTITNGVFGGDGLGSVIDQTLAGVFAGSAAIPAVATGGQAIGSVMKADAAFYTYNALSNIIFDSTNKTVTATGSQYFIDVTDPANPIYGVITLPKFIINNNTYSINLSTTLPDGVTPCYTLVVGGKSYLFDPSNQMVTADRTVFTFNTPLANVYTVSYADVDAPTSSKSQYSIVMTPFSIAAGGVSLPIDVFNTPTALNSIQLGVTGRSYAYNPTQPTITITQGATPPKVVSIQTGLTFVSSSGYGYVIGFANSQYTINGTPMFPYNASIAPTPASYPLMTAPQMFTIEGNFYTFDQDSAGNYLTVTGNTNTYPVNPYQFSLNGQIYILNTSVQPNKVVGGGNSYTMTSGNTQFVIDGSQYTIALKGTSLLGATISGQFDITQANVIVIENYVYELDTLNGQIVGNGTAYPLSTSGFTYTVTTANSSFTVTTLPNATTVAIGNEVYQINNTTVVGDGVTYPILTYRTFTDGANSYSIGFDGTAYTTSSLTLTGTPPLYTRATFTDGATTYTVNDSAAFDGTSYFLIAGTPPPTPTSPPPQFTAGATTYLLRTDSVAVTNGANKTYLVNKGNLSPNSFAFGSETIYFGRPQDLAAFDGKNYYAITNNQFTDTTGNTYTLSGNTAVHDGNSYEIFSNLGQGAYFQVPNGFTYLVNIAVADTGFATPTADIYSVFPITSGAFTMPIVYTVTASGGSASVTSITMPGGTPNSLTASGAELTGGFFTDPVTGVTYNCVVEGSTLTFVDSNNTVYPYPASTPNTFVAEINVSTGVSLAVDSGYTTLFAVTNNQFVTPTTTYTVNLPVAHPSTGSPIFRMVNNRFTVPSTTSVSDIVYSINGSRVTKGYVISGDNEFSADGNTVYTIDAVNVVKSSNQATLAASTLTAGSMVYTLDTTNKLATTTSEGLTFNSATPTFTVTYNGLPVVYTVDVTAHTATDNRKPTNTTFTGKTSGPVLTFTDSISGVTFTFDTAVANGPITTGFPYTNSFFIDTITNVTYYIDTADNRVEDIAYLPETTQYAFIPADGNTYLIHYNDVSVVFPVITGAQVNAGTATVGLDTFAIHIDQITSAAGASAIKVDKNSFELNGNLYTIEGAPTGNSYAGCTVVGDNIQPSTIAAGNTFHLSNPAITYTLQLDASDQPVSVLASFPVLPSRDLISVADDIYIITYNTVSTGSLLGQGMASIPIANSSFTLTNPFDSTKARFIFDDLNIYDAGSVVGQFTVYLSPTFFLDNRTYTLDTVNQIVLDNSKRPYPLVPNPTMFSINGANYLIDTNRVPHSIIGNNNISPLSTDVTVQSGLPVPNSTFTLGGLVYKYTEDAQRNLVTITSTRLYTVDATLQTFKLDSSLVFTINRAAPAAGTYPGTNVPIGTITSGPTTTLNLYAGIPQTANADFFMYKNILYTLLPSATAGKYEAVQKSYPVYTTVPAASQQKLAVFDFNGTTYLITDGTTAGATTPAGISPGSIWSQTATSDVEQQFGLVYGFTAQPTNVIQSADGKFFQFLVTDSATGIPTLYNIQYTAGANTNAVVVAAPQELPSFTQLADFNFINSFPLTLETGGYNAFTPVVDENNVPERSFAAAYRTPIVSTSPNVDKIIGPQGDFSVEFWHSLPLQTITAYHPFTYSASNPNLNVFHVDVDFEDAVNLYVQINDSVLQATTIPPMILSNWRHFALTYVQPYTMLCAGAGFEVKDGSHYDFNRDFSIGMTFAVSDIYTEQTLLYKGTGSSNTPPHLDMSYRVTVSQQQVNLIFKDGEGLSQTFSGPSIDPNQYYELIIVKKTSTGGGQEGSSSDPFALPFDLSELSDISKGTSNVDVGNLPSGSSTTTASFGNVSPQPPSNASTYNDFTSNLQSVNSGTQRYIVSLTIRTVLTNGNFGDWSTYTPIPVAVDGPAGLQINPTGAAHLLIGDGYDDTNTRRALGSVSGGNIRDVYLFNTAIDSVGISTPGKPVTLSQASQQDLVKAGLVGKWVAAYDPNGVVNNLVNTNDVALSLNANSATLAPLAGHEAEGASIYINGVSVPFNLITTTTIPSSLPPYSPSGPSLTFNAGVYKLQELAMWNMARQSYQVSDDMFGQLIPANEPFLSLYLSSSYIWLQPPPVPLPLNTQLDDAPVNNGAALDLQFSNASIDFSGTPCVARCGPLITSNLYTPPGVALTVCDTPPSLTTYSITINSTTGTPAGVLNEAYVYLRDNVLMLYAGKKVGDLVLSWVSQEQGDVQVLGYIEGAPPAPMANLTNKSSYTGATSVTFTVPTSCTLKYQMGGDASNDIKMSLGDAFGANFGVGFTIAPFGGGVSADKYLAHLDLKLGETLDLEGSQDNGNQQTATNKYDESHKYTVKLQGTMSPYTNDLFMSTLNTLTTPSNTPGNPASKTAILPNPNLGGFTTSNPPTALPKTAPTEEKYGQRMFQPSPYGQAFVLSQTFDVYQQTLLQTNTTYGFLRIPNKQTPPDFNIVSFRMSSKYIRPGVLDGMIGYAYNPATLPNGTQTYTTSTGQMTPVNDGNFDQGSVGHDASYMQVIEAYQLKKQIDQQTFNAIALYKTAYQHRTQDLSASLPSGMMANAVGDAISELGPPPGLLPKGIPGLPALDPAMLLSTAFGPLGNPLQLLTTDVQDTANFIARFLGLDSGNSKGVDPSTLMNSSLDFYNEYVWSSRGGTQEIKHALSSTFDQVYTANNVSASGATTNFECKLSSAFMTVLDIKLGSTKTQKQTMKYSYTNTSSVSFDVTASFDGIESDTQMRYSSNNDAHFVMNYNSTFNPNNQSGLNLVIGSDGLVYKIAPSVSSGAGIPLSDNVDTNEIYTQPQPSYTNGNANGLTGILEPYDRPGKTSLFRTYAFFRQPSLQNANDFWNTVVDPLWLKNSPDLDAKAMRSASGSVSIPWRLMYRVTYSQRFLPPISNDTAIVPQITPVMAVPVTNDAAGFLFYPAGSKNPVPANNPANDIEANVVLVAPTQSGLSAYTTPTSGSNPNMPVLPNNVIPFDLFKGFTPALNYGITSWGDATNTRLLAQLITSVLGQNAVVMTASFLPGSTKVSDVLDPVGGGVLYSIYLDPNGLTVNVPAKPGITVLADVNGNPIQYYDGKVYHSLQSDYVASKDGSLLYYIQPPSNYNQGQFDLNGDYDLSTHPGDEWRYYLVSGESSDMTMVATVNGNGIFRGGNSAFNIAESRVDKTGANQVQGFVLIKGMLQYPHINSNAEIFSDLLVYKSMSLFDTFPIGDPTVLTEYLTAQYPGASFVTTPNPEITNVFVRNIISYFNSAQAVLNPK